MIKKQAQSKQLFYYRGLNADKLRVCGHIYAKNRSSLLTMLTEQNICLLACWPCRQPRPLTSDETIWFLDQLQLLLQAGLPVADAIQTLHSQSKRKCQLVLTGIVQSVESGYGLAAGLRPYLKPSAQVIVHLIGSGEQNGQLPAVLEKIVDENRHNAKIKREILQSLAYPVLLSVMAICIITAMMVWVIPEFKNIYAGLGADLPTYTLITIKGAEWFGRYAAWIAVGLFGGVITIILLRRYHNGFHWLFARLSLRLPFFGRLQRAYLCRCFAGHLRIIYQSGLALNEALAWLPETHSHAVYRSALKRIQADIAQGHSLRYAVRNSGFFPRLVEQIIHSGENSGSLEQALVRIEKFYAATLVSTASHLPRLIEPLLIIFIAIVIAWILISLYLPVFNIGFVL